jgi:NAD(P)-dependent dehydrogenase (short-subunit alcohol dehydrogenase family)
VTDSFAVRGKLFVITGGTGGIGRAIALHFARAGASVLANYGHHEDPARRLAADAAGEHLDIALVRGDVTSDEGRRRIVAAIGGRRVSGLVHCAATGVHRRIQELTARQFDFTMAVNARAFLEVVQALLPAIDTGASLVALSSEGAVRAVPYYAAIGASKAALESLCRHLAVELAPRQIRVNVLAAGTVLTSAWNAFPDKAARLEDAIARSPVGHLTEAEEVALAAQFLCSDASRGINGHVLTVDGGASISSAPGTWSRDSDAD